ncbi:MAG: hypothetical protein MJ236_01550 [Clostridia bacterium]|nr:hypothetical protein [Clostridia bacterium]
MKLFKRLVCLSITLVMILTSIVSLSSCGTREKDLVIATYSFGQLKESDLKQWQSYMTALYGDQLSACETELEKYELLSKVYDEATRYWAQIQFLAKEFELMGVTYSENDISNMEKIIIAQFAETYKEQGGWDGISKDLGLDDTFLSQFALSQLVHASLEGFVMGNYEITNEMIKDYYDKNVDQFMIVPSYKLDMIYVPVAEADLAKPDAWAAAKAEAEAYLQRLQAGEDFETVKKDAIANSKDKLTSENYATVSEINKASCERYYYVDVVIESIEEDLAKLLKDEKINFVKYADPKGDAKEYSIWFQYIMLTNEAYVKNALLTLEDGQIHNSVIEFISGYEIIKKVSTSNDVIFQDPFENEEVYKEIKEILYKAAWDDGAGPAVNAVLDKLNKKYELNILFSYEEAFQNSDIKDIIK